MAFFTSKWLNYSRIGFLFFVSFKLLVDPKSVIEYTGVFVLGTSMNLPLLMVNDNSPIYGSLAVLIFVIAFTDLMPLLDGNIQYFELVIPMRLFLFLCSAVYTCIGSSVYICNSLVFAYCFAEAWMSILIYSTLREEKYKRLQEAQVEDKELQEKYIRGDLTKEEEQNVEQVLEDRELKKLMEEFQ